MAKQRLENSKDFFDQVVAPAYRQFNDGAPTFLKVFAVASALYHLAEWIFYHDKDKVQANYGKQITSAGELWQHVEKSVLDAGFIRDLNNTGKHVQLDFDPARPKKRDPSTGMHYAANTHISTASFGEGPFGSGPYGGTGEVKMDEGTREVSLEPIATGVYLFWKAIIETFYPPPAIAVAPSTSPAANS